MDEKTFNSLPLEQRKAAQQRLISLGLYNGNPDGKWGTGTKAAFEQEVKRAEADAKAVRDAEERKRQDDLRAKELEIRSLEAQGGKATSDAEAAKTTAETQRRQRYNEQASSPLGLATDSAAKLVAPAATTALGLALGQGVNREMDASQESKNKVLRGVAADRVAGLTTRDGAREGARLAGAMPLSNTVARTTSRMLPHLGLGAIAAGKGAQILHDNDPNGEFYTQAANRAAGLGYIGLGAGLGKQGLRYAFAPGVAPDAQAIAIINSNQLRRNGASARSGETPDPSSPEAPAKAAAAPGTKAYMQSQAKELGLKGTSKLSKSELATKLAEAMAEHGTKRTVKRVPKLPSGSGAAGIAGALAYGMTPDRADAATGEMTGNTGQALTNAGVAGGTAYGVSKLAEKLSPMAGGALGSGFAMTTPFAAADAYDPSPTRLLQDRVQTGEHLPSWLRFGAIDQAHQMAQVPPRSDNAEIAQAQRMQAERMPLPNASALQIPEGIPAPREDGSDPYAAPQEAAAPQSFAPAIQGRLQRMISTGATPDQIAAWLNQAVR